MAITTVIKTKVCHYYHCFLQASAFNSWFENAEEDLTDPVRCNSLEEITALREAHGEFHKSLSTAEEDFKQLQELDKQIKSFNVGPNPYTWFTMDALEETWRNLQKIIKVQITFHLRTCLRTCLNLRNIWELAYLEKVLLQNESRSLLQAQVMRDARCAFAVYRQFFTTLRHVFLLFKSIVRSMKSMLNP